MYLLPVSLVPKGDFAVFSGHVYIQEYVSRLGRCLFIEEAGILVREFICQFSKTEHDREHLRYGNLSTYYLIVIKSCIMFKSLCLL